MSVLRLVLAMFLIAGSALAQTASPREALPSGAARRRFPVRLLYLYTLGGFRTAEPRRFPTGPPARFHSLPMGDQMNLPAEPLRPTNPNA